MHSKLAEVRSSEVEEGLEYLDYKINLDEVVQQGIEVQLDGHLTDDLSFVPGYAWQDFENQGRELSGETELDDRAEHFFTARLTWQISPATSVTFNYEYQDEQVVKTSTETAPDVYEFEDIPIDSFDIAGISVTHKLFDEFQGLRNCRLMLYCHNLFDEEYENTSGYPGTDLTVGTGISVEF
ncbi:MAG: TonB-dependent receptor [Thermodesulfobacteriota bacterium]|nr:TonB-dependent receptor [Thermodesulfobacteriota bacterium]